MTSVAEQQLASEDYEAIEEAVMETARGRWFLAEYARRHRQADTLTIVSTLERIEKTINRQRKVPDIDRIRLDLADMAEAITRTKQEIFQMKIESEAGGRFAEASNELDAIVSQTEAATETILQNAEKIQELAWTFRENGSDAELCDTLDSAVTEIYTGCSFQDLTGQRTRKVVTVLRYLESRINSMTGIWGLDESGEPVEDVEPQTDEPNQLEILAQAAAAKPEMSRADEQFDPFDQRPDAHLLNGPQLDGRGVDQNEIDDLLRFDVSDDDLAAVDAERALADMEADIFEAPAAATQAEPDVFLPTPVQPVAHPVAVPRAVTIGNVALALEAAPEAEAAPQLQVVPNVDPIAELSAEERKLIFG